MKSVKVIKKEEMDSLRLGVGEKDERKVRKKKKRSGKKLGRSARGKRTSCLVVKAKQKLASRAAPQLCVIQAH